MHLLVPSCLPPEDRSTLSQASGSKNDRGKTYAATVLFYNNINLQHENPQTAGPVTIPDLVLLLFSYYVYLLCLKHKNPA